MGNLGLSYRDKEDCSKTIDHRIPEWLKSMIPQIFKLGGP
jgi:hypothetical protein